MVSNVSKLNYSEENLKEVERALNDLEQVLFSKLQFRSYIPEFTFQTNLLNAFNVSKTDVKGYYFIWYLLHHKYNLKFIKYHEYSLFTEVYYGRLLKIRKSIATLISETEKSNKFAEERFFSLKEDLKDALRNSMKKFKKHQGLTDSEIVEIVSKSLKEIKIEEILK